MDKQQPTLDPKLKEVYERVMGTNVASAPQPQAQTSVAAQPASTVPVASPVSATPTPQQAVSPLPVQPTPTPVNATHVEQKTAKGTTTFVAKNNTGSSKALPVLYVIGGIIFLLVYTIFWMRVFGVPVPFFQ